MATSLTYRGHTRSMLVLGLPLMGGNLAQYLIGLTDTVMLGWYGVEALAAVTLANSYFYILFLLGAGFGWAITPLVAAASIREDHTTIRRVTRMAIWLTLAYGLVMALPLWFSGTVLQALGQDAEISALAQQYLRILCFGIFPALLTNALRSYLAGLERTKVMFAITVVALFVNAAANWALIFGNWGLPELGVTGAALASCATHLVTTFGALVYALHIFPDHRLFQRIWKPDWEILKKVALMGIPIGLTILSEATFFSSTAIMMGWLGTIPLAAHGIVMQLGNAGFNLQLGFANAATVRAGLGNGLGDRQFVARVARVALATVLTISAAAVAIYLLFPEQLISFFLEADDPRRSEIITIGVVLVGMVAIYQTLDGVQVVMIGLLRGLQDTAWPMVLAAISYWGVGIPTSYIFGIVLGFGAIGIWFGLVTALGTASILLIWRFFKGPLRRVGQLTA